MSPLQHDYDILGNATAGNKVFMPAAGDVFICRLIFILRFGTWDKTQLRKPHPS